MSKRNITAILLIASAFSFACNTAAPPQRMEGRETAAQAARGAGSIPMPDERDVASALNVAIEKLDGSTFKLADFRGKILVVDFWRSDCAPCLRLVPKLANLSKQYRDKGVEVVGLTSDEKTEQSDVVKVLKKAGADYTVGYDNRWLSSAFLKGTEDETGAPPIPQVFVLSREGRVIEHLIGESPQRGAEYLERVIVDTLNGSSK
ncbi:MAG: TlpA family protein disulfide reductase [Blastocatellia bacterium]|nr:TlpA family protein disulfide reductase [Blastocatellia bacterium]